MLLFCFFRQSKHQLTEMHTKLTNYKENKIILKENLNSEKHRADHNENKLKGIDYFFLLTFFYRVIKK